MVAYTPNYDLALPTVGADRNIWGGELNGNTSFFDTFLRSFQNTFIGNTAPDTFQTGTFWINNTVTDPVTPWTYSVYDGTQWVMVGMIDPVLHKFIPSNATFQLNVVTISNSGTYTPSPGLIYCIAEVIGAGGGGGGVAANTVNNGAGGGGGGGGYSRGLFTAAQIGASQIATIGAGGTATAGNFAGGTGGLTSLGTLISVTGGLGGGGSATAGPLGVSLGGAGGVGSGGTINTTGTPGGIGFTTTTSGIGNVKCAGFGGSSFFGGGAVALGDYNGPGSAGNAATSYGGGGGGAHSDTSNTNYAGGVGFAGFITITEYIL